MSLNFHQVGGPVRIWTSKSVGLPLVFSTANLSTFPSSMSLHYGEARICSALHARVQSGVLFLGHSFGLPAIAADVGNLKEEIIKWETGFVFTPRDSSDLAPSIDNYFESDLIPKPGTQSTKDQKVRQRAIFVGQSRRDHDECLLRSAAQNRGERAVYGLASSLERPTAQRERPSARRERPTLWPGKTDGLEPGSKGDRTQTTVSKR